MGLSIGKLGVGQERYYEAKVAEGREDYYAGEGEAEGFWIGNAAANLGLQGKVEPKQLGAILSGQDPVADAPLGLRAAPGRAAVPGFDLTFSAPKSVSLTWALGGHPVSGEVREAHHAAVAKALAYMERNACWARRGKGGAQFVPGNGFLAAAYVHRSSRAGDPQLHTHVLIANATLGPDGRWSRLFHPAIYEHARTAGFIYEAHLRHELTRRLGVEWEAVKNGIADIRGFSAEELRHFSTRRAEILAAAGDGASARAMQVATLATRKAKERDLTTESLREAWRAKAAEIGLDREVIAGRLGHERPGATVLTVQQIEHSVTAYASHFDRRDAIRAVAENLPHGAPAAEIEELADAFLASESVIEIALTPRGPRFTTDRIWRLEQRALAVAERMQRSEGRAAVDPILVCRVLDARPSLKDDQRAMVERLLAGGRGLEVVIGEAGAGKTYATVAAASGWTTAGYELQVAAPTWRAANVLRTEGVDAQTVAGLFARLDARAEAGETALPANAVLLVDEAGMVDSASLARLIDHAEKARVKLVLVGDPEQLREVEAGGLFAAIARRSEPIHLGEVIRHRHELDREAAKMIREGRGSEAIERYAREGRVVVAADHELRREAIVADWWEAERRGEDALMIAKANSERERLNARARELLLVDGRLGGEEIEVGGRRFAAGDEVITRVNDQRAQIYNRERWRVEAVDAESGRLRLAGIDTNRQVGVDPGYLKRVNPSDGAPAIEHGYAATIYQAQGATLDSAYVMADPSMDRQEFYVAASRTRGATYFYATPEVGFDRIEFAPAQPVTEGLTHIALAAERDGAQAAAHDVALRERLGGLPTEELFVRRHELAAKVGAEDTREETLQALAERIARSRERAQKVAEELRRLGPEPQGLRKRAEREEHREKADCLRVRQHHGRNVLAGLEGEMSEKAEVSHAARAERAVLEHLIEERMRARLAAVRLDPPTYLVEELGERPGNPAKRQTWDRAVAGIERYRAEHSIVDRDSTLGPQPENVIERRQQKRARELIHRARRDLGLEQTQAVDRTIGIGIER